MGAGIAAALALAGVPTTVVVRRPEAVAEAGEGVRGRLEAHERLGLASREQADDAAGLVDVRLGPGGGPYELVFETVAEELAAKCQLLARAEPLVAEGGVLCTNTSSLPIGELAAALDEPGRFAGWHWFHPADLVQAVEVVPGPATRREVVERLAGWSRALGKTPIVLAKETPGFVANRLQYALLREAYALVAGGVCTVEDVDAAVTDGLGARWSAIGPFASMDLAGLDVHSAVARRLFPVLSKEEDVPGLLAETIGSGALGAKNGAGLRGNYTADELAAVLARRDEALAARLRS